LGSHIIQRGELQARLQRGLHLKTGTPAPQVHDVVVPVVLLEDLSRIDDNVQLADQRPMWGTKTAGASVGNFSVCSLVNPKQALASQDKILVVDRICVSIAGVNWRASIEPAVGGSVIQFNRDSRYVPIQGSIALTEFSFPAASPAQAIEVPSTITQIENTAIVITAGFMLSVYTAVVNTGITVSWFWREFDTVIK
jgi:hypothetical protein